MIKLMPGQRTMRRLVTIVVAIASLVMALAVVPSSYADTVAPVPAGGISQAPLTPASYAALVFSLQANGATSNSDGTITYNPGGVELTLSLPPAAPGRSLPQAGANPYLGIGGAFWWPVVTFNRTDQIALASGAAAGLAAAICAIPAVGWVACAAAVAIATAATVYIAQNGLCPSNRPTLAVPVFSPSSSRCA